MNKSIFVVEILNPISKKKEIHKFTKRKPAQDKFAYAKKLNRECILIEEQTREFTLDYHMKGD